MRWAAPSCATQKGACPGWFDLADCDLGTHLLHQGLRRVVSHQAAPS